MSGNVAVNHVRLGTYQVSCHGFVRKRKFIGKFRFIGNPRSIGNLRFVGNLGFIFECRNRLRGFAAGSWVWSWGCRNVFSCIPCRSRPNFFRNRAALVAATTSRSVCNRHLSALVVARHWRYGVDVLDEWVEIDYLVF